jgi:hypothetical protein|tara:strand:- start:1005 stop:1343 length:339 start_codon:yes stop_codon:yes gene_type:complete
MTEDKSELLVNALITKMEAMDSNIEILKQENERLKNIINNPQKLLRKMGMVKTTTPFTEDLQDDPFRNDLNNNSILKGQNTTIPQTNEEYHNMDWEEIHELANQAKNTDVIQ